MLGPSRRAKYRIQIYLQNSEEYKSLRIVNLSMAASGVDNEN